MVPLSASALKEIEITQRPIDGREIKALEAEMQFSYRAPLGELISAYKTCRLDIGNTIA